MTASFGEAVSRSGPRPFGYPQSWGDHRPKTSAKLICPSNNARIASSVRFVTIAVARILYMLDHRFLPNAEIG
jgi:hypothetical protein